MPLPSIQMSDLLNKLDTSVGFMVISIKLNRREVIIYDRLVNFSPQHSFFLFGARSTGKSFWLKKFFPQQDPKNWWIDLLDADIELEYSSQPQKLLRDFLGMDTKPQRIIIDEVQKVPAILDIVHQIIENHSKYNVKFVLTGSSARKLKRTNANMLAGRAFNFHLFPLTHLELKKNFDLDQVLQWGSLPKIFTRELKSNQDRNRFLKSYINTYLKQEIMAEQIVRGLPPFQRFLDVAAQMNGEVVNYSKIAREAKTADKNVSRYFEILCDTLIGVFLPAYHRSIRKQQISSPKFYFFDLGVLRALKGVTTLPIYPATYEYGKAFEHFIILEIYRLNDYYEKDFKLFYLKDSSGNELDLVIEKPDQTQWLIEIKSGVVKSMDKLKSLSTFLANFPKGQAMVISNNPKKVLLDTDSQIFALPWKEALQAIFN